MLYLLSVLDSVGAFLCITAVLLCLAAVVSFVVYGVHDSPEGARGYDNDTRVRASVVRLWRFLPLIPLFAVAAALTPSTRSLKNAYVMVEAPKVLTANNAEAAARELSKKLDALIEAVK